MTFTDKEKSIFSLVVLIGLAVGAGTFIGQAIVPAPKFKSFPPCMCNCRHGDGRPTGALGATVKGQVQP